MHTHNSKTLYYIHSILILHRTVALAGLSKYHQLAVYAILSMPEDNELYLHR